jgi:hypothetical protein
MDYLEYKNYLAHSKGDWKVHKYVRKSNGKYFYSRQRGETTASGGVNKRPMGMQLKLEQGTGTEDDPYVLSCNTLDAYEYLINNDHFRETVDYYCANKPNSMQLREEMDRTGKYHIYDPETNEYGVVDLTKASAFVKEQARKKAISNYAKENNINLMRPTYKPKKTIKADRSKLRY